MADLIALGELLIDFAPSGTNAEGFPCLEAHPGGAPANFLGAAARFGVSAAMVGKVGDDSFGRLLVEFLRKNGIQADGIVLDAGVFTTLAFVSLDANGNRDFSFARKPGADTMLRFEEVDLSFIQQAKVFHFGTLSLTGSPAREATRQAVAFAREQGLLVSFDPNLRLPLWKEPEMARREILWGLAQADVVKISLEEVEFLWQIGPAAGARKILEDFGASLVYVTCGADGCYYAGRKAEGFVPALPGVHPVDTTGAGDIFGGAAMAGLLELGKSPELLTGQELESIVRFATVAAGLSTERSGGLSSIPMQEEVTGRLNRMGWLG